MRGPKSWISNGTSAMYELGGESVARYTSCSFLSVTGLPIAASYRSILLWRNMHQLRVMEAL